jgi:hypothetical protein
MANGRMRTASQHPLRARMNPICVSSRAGHQQEFFPLEGAPDGLLFEPEIMTPAEEAAFLNVITTLPFGAFRMHGVDAKRRVVRFGAHYVAGSAEMRPTSEFPPYSCAGTGCRIRRYAGTYLVRVARDGISPGGRHRLALRFATVRDRGWHLVGRSLPYALSTRRGTAAADLGSRSSSSIALCDERSRPGRMAAQHTARQRAPLVDYISNVEKCDVVGVTFQLPKPP